MGWANKINELAETCGMYFFCELAVFSEAWLTLRGHDYPPTGMAYIRGLSASGGKGEGGFFPLLLLSPLPGKNWEGG